MEQHDFTVQKTAQSHTKIILTKRKIMWNGDKYAGAEIQAIKNMSSQLPAPGSSH